jgi:hypothetical protein
MACDDGGMTSSRTDQMGAIEIVNDLVQERSALRRVVDRFMNGWEPHLIHGEWIRGDETVLMGAPEAAAIREVRDAG